MTRGRTPVELQEYITQLVEQTNMSMRKASIKCGLNPDTIGTILRDGNQPRPDTLAAIAGGLNGDYHRMLALAGYVAPPPEIAEANNEELRYDVLQIERILAELMRYAPDKARMLIDATLMQLEITLTAYRDKEKDQSYEKQGPGVDIP